MRFSRHKAEEGAKTISLFLNQFGEDEHSKIVLNYIFELLYNRNNHENIHLSSNAEQTTDQSLDDIE